MNRILIAEDEERIASFVQKGLRANGFTTVVAEDGDLALGHALTGGFDLMVLDIGLPGRDGFTVLRELRESRVTLPVIVLTARDSVRDTVAGLEGGADDWMTKPFRFEELLARIRLRQRTAARAPEVTLLRSGSLTLDLRTRRARAEERTVDLTAREFVLLEMFLRHPGQVLSREQILSHVWGVRLRPRLQHRGRLRPRAPPEAGRGAAGDGTGHGVPAAVGGGLPPGSSAAGQRADERSFTGYSLTAHPAFRGCTACLLLSSGPSASGAAAPLRPPRRSRRRPRPRGRRAALPRRLRPGHRRMDRHPGGRRLRRARRGAGADGDGG